MPYLATFLASLLGFFNHRVVTLVAGKLERWWLFFFVLGTIANCIRQPHGVSCPVSGSPVCNRNMEVPTTTLKCIRTLQNQVGCFSHRVVTLVAYTQERRQYERITLVWKTNCIRQPQRQMSSSSYNHNKLTTHRTSVNESSQMHFNQSKELPYQETTVQLSYSM